MLQRLKLRLLRAAFTERGDHQLVDAAADSVMERIEALYPRHADDEAQMNAWAETYVAVCGAIERYKVLRAGPPARPPKEKRTPRRPLRERGRIAVTELLRRLRMAARIVFLGHRPATVGFDAIDRRIAENCAFGIADTISGRYAPPQQTMDEDDTICRQIAWLVYEAIAAYVTYSAESEALARRNLAAEEPRRDGEDKKASDIPF